VNRESLVLSSPDNNIGLPASPTKPRIVIADDYGPMLAEVSRLLRSEFEIVAAVSNGAWAVKCVTEMEPDAVVLDIHMPELGGINAAQSLKRTGSAVKVVFLTIETDPEYVKIATAMGASYVVKSRIGSDLGVALKEALAGRVFVSSR
jgi:DNA-binding NarL/FixJ family response regulator